MRRGQVMGRKGVVWLKVPVTKNRPRGLCAHPPTPPDWEQGGEKAGATASVLPILQGRGHIKSDLPERGVGIWTAVGPLFRESHFLRLTHACGKPLPYGRRSVRSRERQRAV